MKLSFENNGTTISFEIDREEISLTDFMEGVEHIMYGSGFHRDNLNDWIIEWGSELKNDK